MKTTQPSDSLNSCFFASSFQRLEKLFLNGPTETRQMEGIHHFGLKASKDKNESRGGFSPIMSPIERKKRYKKTK